MNATNPFVALQPDTPVQLPAGERFGAAGHKWSQPEIDALIFATAAGRPLLVRGEAGSGKSQIARAAAWHLGETEPLVEVIHARFEALDLLYKVDTLARLADAQIQGCLDPTNQRYVTKGCLWEAMEPDDTGERAGQTEEKGQPPIPVVLIDEIDKADADVPNALLDVLGNRSFTVPWLARGPVRAKDGRMPLIVITTNEERELPPAFVRRCAVLNLAPPEGEADFIAWLVDRGQVHEHLTIADEARTLAARQVLADRQAAEREGYPKVGLAEYIDLLTALHALTWDRPEEARAKEQMVWIRRLGAYALVKYPGPGQPQRREPVSPGPAVEDPEQP